MLLGATDQLRHSNGTRTRVFELRSRRQAERLLSTDPDDTARALGSRFGLEQALAYAAATLDLHAP